jgi:hypothetical protein
MGSRETGFEKLRNTYFIKQIIKMPSQQEYYTSLSKSDIFADPQKYPWNCLLYYVQFTQSELVQAKPWIDVKSMVRYQKCLTQKFVHDHFQQDVDDDDILTWQEVYLHVKI